MPPFEARFKAVSIRALIVQSRAPLSFTIIFASLTPNSLNTSVIVFLIDVSNLSETTESICMSIPPLPGATSIYISLDSIAVSYTHLDVYKRQAEMRDFIKGKYPNIEVEALGDIKEISKHINLNNYDEIYAFTGSLYMIGFARTLINNIIKHHS